MHWWNWGRAGGGATDVPVRLRGEREGWIEFRAKTRRGERE